MTTRRPVTDLLPDTTYAIRVRAINDSGSSEWSQRLTFTTIADTTPPATPSNVTWVSSGDSFHAEWDAVTTNVNLNTIPVTRYEIELIANSITKVVSVTPSTGAKVSYDLSFEENRALFGTPQPTVTFRVRAVDNKDLKGAYSSVLSASNQPPTAPSSITGTAGADQIALTWTASSDNDIIGYRVHVGTTSGFTPNSGNKIFEGDALSYSYTTTNYSPQWFKVYAVDKFGQQSTTATTTASSITPISPFIVDTTAPSAPTTVTVATGYDVTRKEAYTDVTWSAVAASDLAKYTVRYGPTTSGPWTYFDGDKDVTTTRLYTQPGVALYIGVRAEDWAANKSGYTNASTYPITAGADSTPPPQVTGLAVSPQGTSFISTWSAVSANDLKEYEVGVNYSGGTEVFYRTTATRFDFTLEMNRAAFTTPRAAVQIRVRAIDFANNAGTWSSTVTGTNASPAAPTTLTNAIGANSITVGWTAAADADIIGYNVYQGTSASPTTKVGFVDGTSYTVTTNTTPQYFSIKSVDVFGQESAALSGGPFTATNPFLVDTTPPSAPATSTVATGYDTTRKEAYLDVSWAAVGGDNALYVVRYGPSTSGPWTYVNADKDTTSTRVYVTPGVAYYVGVRTEDYASNKSAFTNAGTYPITAGADATPPAQVTGLVVNSVGTSFIATWTAATDNDFKEYEIGVNYSGGTEVFYRQNGTRFDFTLERNRSAFTTPRASVQIRVRAIDFANNAGTWSSTVTGTNSAPSAPTSLVSSLGANSITLSWTASSATGDIVGYNVYQGTSASPTTKVAFGDSTTFTTTVGTVAQYFTIKAVDAFGQESAALNGGPFTAPNPYIVDNVAPAVPTITSATLFNIGSSKSSSLAVGWSAVGDSDLQGYVVRYLKNGSTVWTQVNVSKDETGIFIEGLVPYVSYDVQIRSFDYNGNYSAWSATTTATAPANAVPANVTGLTALPGKDNIAYSWQPVADLDIKNYELTFSTSSTFASGNVQYLTGNSTNVPVSGLAPGTTYYARVRAIDEGGNTSAAWSSTVSSTTVAYGTYTSDGAAPTSSPAAVVSAGIGNLFINWNAVTNNDPVTYEVHISTVSGFTPTAGGATRITEVSGTSTTLEKYTDGNPLAYNTTYYVRIIAKDKDGAAAPGTVGSGSPAKAFGADIGAVIGGENLFSNTEFNGGLTPWVARGTGVTVALETTNVLNPNVNSARVTMGSTLQSDWGIGLNNGLHYVPVQPNTTYTVSAWFKADSGTPNTYIHSRFYQSDKTTFVTAVSTANTPINATGWTRITSTFTTGANTYWMISIFGCANASTVFYVTQPQLEVGDVATQWQKSTSELAVKLNQTDSLAQSNFLNTNQTFNDWPITSATPTGWGFTGSTHSKETTIVKTLPNAIKWTLAAGATGWIQSGSTGSAATIGDAEYLTYEADIYLVSGDLQGTGVLIDWNGYNGSYIRVNDSWATAVPTATVGKWTRVTRTVKRPTITSGAFTYLNILFMAGYTGGGFGSVSAKEIVLDRFSIRQATAQEIQAYEAKGYTDTVVATSASGKNKVTYSTSLPGSTANIAGDTWFVRDASTGVIIAQYEGAGGTSWISRQLRNEVISSLDVGKLLSGSITSADIQVASTGAIRSTDYAVGATGWKISTNGLEINSGAINAGVINAGFLSANRIAANSLSISKLIVTDLSNLLEDGSFENGASGWTMGSGASVVTETSVPVGGTKVLQITSNGNISDTSSYVIPVSPGETWYAETYVRKTTTGTTGNIGLQVTQLLDGVAVSYPTFQNLGMVGLTQNVWTKLSGRYTVPAGVNQIMVRASVRNDVPAGEIIQFDNIILRKAANAELLVDGSITANKMVVGTITAASGILADAVITTAKIADANITNAKIADLAVTNAKIADATITDAKISNLNVSKLTAGTVGSGVGITMAAGSSILLNGGHIRSNTYNGAGNAYDASATAGFYLGNDGLRIAQGAISASTLTTGTITTSTITISTSGLIQSGNYVAGTAGWQLSNTGLEINGGTIRAAALQVTTGGMNIFKNSSFSSSAAITTNYIANGSATISYDATENYIGLPAQSGRATSTGAVNAGIYQEVQYTELKPNTQYLFTAYVKNPSTNGVGNVQATVQAVSGATLSGLTGVSTAIPSSTTTLDTWVRIGVKFTTGANTSGLYRLFIYRGGASTAGNYFNTDAWQLEEGDFVSTYSPRQDEILPGTVNGNAIITNTLSAQTIQTGTALAANLNVTGTLTLGTASSGSSGNIRSFAYTAGSVGWNINYAGDAEFNNVIVRGNLQGNSSSVITGGTYLTAANVGNGGGPAGIKLDSTGIKGYSGGTTETFSVLSASGNVTIAGTNAIGGNTTVTGTTSLGGTLTVAGGISVTGSAGSAYIRGGGFSGTTSASASGTGYILDVNGLYIGPGSSVSASALNIQSSNNLLGSRWAGVDIALPTPINGTTLSWDTTNVYQGDRAVRVVYAGGAASRGVSFTNNVLTEAIPVEQGHTYFISAWVRNNTTTPTSLIFGYVDQANNYTSSGISNIVSAVPSSASGWVRIYASFAPPVSVTSIRPYFLQTATTAFDFTADAFQVEERYGATVPGPWIAPGVTTIDGGQIRTGAITSTTTLATGSPSWSINTSGAATFSNMSIWGNTILGDAANANSIIRSFNWTGTGGTAGWGILADGSAFFNNITIKTTGTFGGTITSTADIQGGTVTGATLRTSSTATTNGVILDSTGIKAYSGSTNYFSVSSSGLTLSSGSLTVSGTGNVNINGGNLTVSSGYIRGGGNSSTTYAGASGNGYFMDQNGLYIGSNGRITATALLLQSGGTNMVPGQWSAFELPGSFYPTTVSVANGATASVVVDNAQAWNGTQSLKLTMSNTTTANGYAEYRQIPAIPVESGKTYIASVYVRQVGGAASDSQVLLVVDGASFGGTYRGASSTTNITTVDTWTRYSFTFVAGASETAVKPYLRITNPTTTARTNRVYHFDGFMIEQQMGGLTTPSTYSISGVTEVDGGMIKTGEIRSVNNVTIDGQSKPVWSIPLNGAATFSGLNVYGNVVVGNSATDTQTQIASSNFVQGASGWRIRGNGEAELNDVTVRGNLQGNSSSIISGGIIQTATSGQRIVIRNDGSGGIIEFFSGVSGETAGYINPQLESGSFPSISIGSPTTPTFSSQSTFIMGSSPTANGRKMNINSGMVSISGSASAKLTSAAYSALEVSGGLGVLALSNEIYGEVQSHITLKAGGNLSMEATGFITSNKPIYVAGVVWNSATITSPFTAVSGQTPEYLQDAVGNVHLRGAVNRNTGTSGATIMTLPAGYRPSVNVYGTVRTNAVGTYASIQVTTAGVVSCTWTGTPSALGIDIVFSTI